MEKEKEFWKTIKGYPKYEVSSKGLVRVSSSLKLLKLSNVNGYRSVSLNQSGKVRSFRVHRLVAIAFIKNPSNKNIVNHKDGNKSNNKVENLEWSTSSENQKHKTDVLFNGNFGLSKLTKEDLINIRLMASIVDDGNYLPIREKYKINDKLIKQILKTK
jgi:hypothetical protein